MNTDCKTIKEILRAQAWERAKGELLSILSTYYGEEKEFKAMDKEINKLIRFVEDNGYCGQ
jgi:hypothetical protein